jgi:hypothetical protein
MIAGFGKLFARQHLSTAVSNPKGVTIVEGKMALLYLIISAMITFFYAGDENVDRLKHAINALALTQIHAAKE